MLEQSARILAFTLGMLLWLISSFVKIHDPLLFLIGSSLILFSLNGKQFSSFSLGKEGVKMENPPEKSASMASPSNTIEIKAKEPIPKELSNEAGKISATIQTAGYGEVKIIHPTPNIAVGIGATIANSGSSQPNIVGIGIYEPSQDNCSKLLVFGSDGQTYKIDYQSEGDDRQKLPENS